MLKAWIEKQLREVEDRLFERLRGYIDRKLEKQGQPSGMVQLPILTLEDVVEMSKKAKHQTLTITPEKTVVDFPKKKKKGGWSQKPHERKGHYRQYPDGRKVWVKPSRIHADD